MSASKTFLSVVASPVWLNPAAASASKTSGALNETLLLSNAAAASAHALRQLRNIGNGIMLPPS